MPGTDLNCIVISQMNIPDKICELLLPSFLYIKTFRVTTLINCFRRG